MIITTSHTRIDYQMVVDHARILFDTKNANKNSKREMGESYTIIGKKQVFC